MRVRILKNMDGEFETPTGEFGNSGDGFRKDAYVYFADDKQDAIDTARFTYGNDVEIAYARGSYQGDLELSR